MIESTGRHWSVIDEAPPVHVGEWLGREWFCPPASRHFEVALVAIGDKAHRFARSLQVHPCCRPDYGCGFAGARVFALETMGARAIAEQERVCEHLVARLGASKWVVIVVSEDSPWETFLANGDCFAGNFSGHLVQLVDLRETSDTGFPSPAFWKRWQCGFLAGRHGCAGGFPRAPHLSGVAEAIAYSVFQPGFICLDWHKVRDALYNGPGVAVAGHGSAERGGSVEPAITRAFAHWRCNRTGIESRADIVMLVLGTSAEDSATVQELDAITDRFFAEFPEGNTARRLLATPVLPPGPSEAVVITKHRPEDLDAVSG